MPQSTPNDLLQSLVALFPAFEPYWQSNDTFRGNDGSFTFCGVFLIFTWFFRESFEQLPLASMSALAELVERCMSEPNSEIDTAAATCFLENLAGEAISPQLKTFLTGNSLRYFEQLDSPPETVAAMRKARNPKRTDRE